MKKDPFIRDYSAPAPLLPGTSVRCHWPEYYDADVERIRSGVDGGGKGLYVLVAPNRSRKLIVEAYYPEGIKHSFYEQELDPHRRCDYQDGNLIVVHVWRVLDRPIDQRVIDEIRRNDRGADTNLSRASSAHARKLEMQNMREQEEQEKVSDFLDAYVDAALETRKFMKPRNTSTRRIA